MSNVFRTICVPASGLAEVQTALSAFSESEGMFTIPCYYAESPIPNFYISSGSISVDFLANIPAVEGLIISPEECHVVLDANGLFLAQPAPYWGE